MISAGFHHELGNGSVQCDLCHHFCRILPGRSGSCRVRKNIDGRLFSLNYGYPVSAHVDPVEKKPLYHFLPGSWTYSIGTLGCNFACANCQNWEISQASTEELNISYTGPDTVVREAVKAGCPSIAYTYNEPTVFAEYALAIMKPARQQGLKNIWVSNGYMSSLCLDAVEPWLDAANIDLKSMDSGFYQNQCNAQLQPVLDNLRRLARSQVHLEITTLIIPGLSDSPAMLEKLVQFIAEELGPHVPWHIIPFNPDISWKLTDVPPAGSAAVELAWTLGKQAGLFYIYSLSHTDTLCPQCGASVVERHWFNRWHNIIRADVNTRCPACSAQAYIKD